MVDHDGVGERKKQKTKLFYLFDSKGKKFCKSAKVTLDAHTVTVFLPVRTNPTLLKFSNWMQSIKTPQKKNIKSTLNEFSKKKKKCKNPKTGQFLLTASKQEPHDCIRRIKQPSSTRVCSQSARLATAKHCHCCWMDVSLLGGQIYKSISSSHTVGTLSQQQILSVGS